MPGAKSTPLPATAEVRPVRWVRVGRLLALGIWVASSLGAQSWLGWMETEADGVTFVSQTEPERTRELVESLVEFRSALRVLAPAAVHDPPVPTQVVIFADERGYRSYKHVRGQSTEHLVGHFTASTFGDWIAINGDPAVGDAFRAIFHEATHAFVAHNFPRVPLWLNEGLAEYYSTFRVAGDRVEVGHAIGHHLRTLETSGLMSLKTLFAVDSTSSHYREGDRSGQFYAQSWLLVHYLLGHSDDGRVEEFLGAVSEGVGSEKAFRSAFGMSWGQVEAALRSYLRRDTYDYWSLPRGERVERPALRLLPANRARYRLGTFLAVTRPDSAAWAEVRLRAAADSGVADAWASLGYLKERAGDREEAQRLYDRAMAGGARESLSYTLYGRFLLADVQPGGVTAAWAREILEQAVELDPSFVEPRALLGSTYLFAPPEEAPAGIRQLREAWSRLPGRLDIPFNLAMLLLRAGDLGGAERLVEQVVAAGDEKLGKQGREAIEDARRLQVLHSQTERYNEAVELANQGEPRGALRILAVLAREDLPDNLRQAVDSALVRLREALN